MSKVAAVVGWFTPKRRRYLYRVGWAGFGLASTYGVLTGAEIAAWGFLGTALLGMADANTKPEQS